MEINWGVFIPSLLLLLYPLERLLPAKMKCRSYENLTDPAFRHRRRWWRWQPELWLDVVRIAVGAGFVKLSVTAVNSESGKFVLPVIGGALVAGLGAQMITRRKEGTLLAPLGYVLGVTLSFFPLVPAMSVLALAVVAMGATQHFNAYFVGGSMAALALGYFFAGSVSTTIMIAGLYYLPVLISMLMQRKLLLAVRSAAQSEKVPSPLR